jgi:arylsulfatase A
MSTKILTPFNRLIPLTSLTSLTPLPGSFLALLLASLVVWGVASAQGIAFDDEQSDSDPPPNVVIIFTDDLGYADLGCFGAEQLSTPHLDRMAAEGVRFTDFYVAQAVCGASRAALLSGCYPNRIGLTGAPDHRARHGIHPDEQLLPELMREQGYATAIFGKWHLGHLEPFLPLQHGFDEYFGLPYSNDMWPHHPTAGHIYPPLPLIEGNRVIATNPDQTQLTTWYTERTVDFIRRHRDQPFFVYLAHSMPHVPLFVSDKHRDQSPEGLFGDVVAEIDWSVGQVLQTLQELEIDRQTLVIFTSDNGPWLSYGNHAGSAGPLREGKGTTWEGGVRVPFIARWPGKIPEGTTSRHLATAMDLVPTICGITGAPLPKRKIDGLDLTRSLLEPETSEPVRSEFFYYWGHELQAVRLGDWKLHFPHTYRSLQGEPGRDGLPDGYRQAECGLELYHLAEDPGESNDLAEERPELVRLLSERAEAMRQELGDQLLDRPGPERRPPGRADVAENGDEQ